MPEQDQRIDQAHQGRLPGIDADANPLLGLGLGLTGLALGLRPKVAPIPLALTALAAVLYRDPHRTTPDEPATIFAPADGTITKIEEVYEHRFVHSDCLRIMIHSSPIDVPVMRAPVGGTVRYRASISGERHRLNHAKASDRNSRAYLGIEASHGLVLVVQIAGPLVHRQRLHTEDGATLQAGARLGTMRFGSQIDLYVQRDSLELLADVGDRLTAGVTRLARWIALE